MNGSTGDEGMDCLEVVQVERLMTWDYCDLRNPIPLGVPSAPPPMRIIGVTLLLPGGSYLCKVQKSSISLITRVKRSISLITRVRNGYRYFCNYPGDVISLMNYSWTFKLMYRRQELELPLADGLITWAIFLQLPGEYFSNYPGECGEKSSNFHWLIVITQAFFNGFYYLGLPANSLISLIA